MKLSIHKRKHLSYTSPFCPVSPSPFPLHPPPLYLLSSGVARFDETVGPLGYCIIIMVLTSEGNHYQTIPEATSHHSNYYKASW